MFAGQHLQGKPSAHLRSSSFDPMGDELLDLPDLPQPAAEILCGPANSSASLKQASPAKSSEKERRSASSSKGRVPRAGRSGKGSGGKGRSPSHTRPAQHEVVTDEVAPQAFASSQNVPDSIPSISKDESDVKIDEEVCRLIATSWKELKENEEKHKNGSSKKEEGADSDSEGKADQYEGEQQKQSQSKGSRLRFWQRGTSQKDAQGQEKAAKGQANKHGKSATLDIPQTFKEMCALNAGMTGANQSYILIVEQCFERLVMAMVTGDHARLELETNIMALRMHKDVSGKIVLAEFKTCMLASLRSLLPKSWSISHEQAWITMWDLVEEILSSNMGKPAEYGKAVEQSIKSMDEEDKKQFGLNAFNALFDKQPKAEDHFNTSNSRLSVLAMNVLDLCGEMYQDPTRTEQIVTSLGLRHIMYNISLEYFEPFVVAFVEELAGFVKDPLALAGVEWVLTQIAAIMINTVKEGSNPLLRAVINNSPKQVRAALAPVAKKDRAGACLGTVTKF